MQLKPKIRARSLVLAFSSALNIVNLAHAQKVFVGTADYAAEAAEHLDQWRYVQEHADGLYVSFNMMNRLIGRRPDLASPVLASFCQSFSTRSAYLESDVRTPFPGTTGNGGGGAHDGASAAQDQGYILALHRAGCKVIYTSLNYGWSADRAYNLTKYDLLPEEGRRFNFVQTGPWVLNGDIQGPSITANRDFNKTLRTYILRSDGVSTDGPMGYWKTDFHGMRNGTVSLVKFAHANGRMAMVMIAPYGANQSVYNPTIDFLSEAQSVVHTLEAAHAVPDLYVVYEYATAIHAIPEAINGQPANTTKGVAYWLIHHLHDRSDYP